MIIYQNTSEKFINDVDNNLIVNEITKAYYEKLNRNAPPSEKRSWRNSLQFMERVVRKSNVSNDCGILIEYTLKPTSMRIDFIIAGEDDYANKNFIIIELKQWGKAEKVEGTRHQVETYINGSIIPTNHPCYQASSYKAFFSDYNEAVYSGDVNVESCAFMHNYQKKNPEPLLDNEYSLLIAESPIFFEDDFDKLQDFLNRYVGKGNGLNILYTIENSKIKPSKSLIQHVDGMFQGNKEFILLGNQNTAFEYAYKYAKEASKKTTIIIKGGPGTGKSVISMKLLHEILLLGENTIFVAPNAAFKDVMIEKLAQNRSRNRIESMFKGSMSFYGAKDNEIRTIIVDEAHRLKDNRQNMYLGENQIKDIINASLINIFFVDDNQKVVPADIGSVQEIKRVAKSFGSDIYEFELKAQFRCSGAEGYINWLDNLFELRETANYDGFDQKDFVFQILDNPNDVWKKILNHNFNNEYARMVAGFAWQWTSAKNGNPDAEIYDVRLDAYSFALPWNSRKQRTLWALKKERVNQIGCIHTCQGLEFEYVGVFIGKDLTYDVNKKKFVANWKRYFDSSGKKGFSNDPQELVPLLKNIYKTLLTRGMKGCYVFVEDKGLREHMRKSLISSQIKEG